VEREQWAYRMIIGSIGLTIIDVHTTTSRTLPIPDDRSMHLLCALRGQNALNQ
jgi:hypothetical protein